MTALLLDTHAALWLATDPRRLGSKAKRRIDAAQAADGLLISSVSLWELSYLEQRGRIRIEVPLREFRAGLLRLGVREWAIDGETAMRATEVLPGHKDLFDRFIAASSLTAEAILMTADVPLLEWKHPLVRIDAKK